MKLGFSYLKLVESYRGQLTEQSSGELEGQLGE